jgi:hypothetical protein
MIFKCHARRGFNSGERTKKGLPVALASLHLLPLLPEVVAEVSKRWALGRTIDAGSVQEGFKRIASIFGALFPATPPTDLNTLCTQKYAK